VAIDNARQAPRRFGDEIESEEAKPRNSFAGVPGTAGFLPLTGRSGGGANKIEGPEGRSFISRGFAHRCPGRRYAPCAPIAALPTPGIAP